MRAFYFTFLLLINTALLAQRPGTTDKTYGDNGSGSAAFTDRYGAACLAIQKDDKILTGSYDYRPEEYTTNTLTRRNNDGSLDTTFGSRGTAYTNVKDLRPNFIQTYGWDCIAVASDGKIIVAGGLSWDNPNPPISSDFLGDDDIVLARFFPDGRIDSSFGNMGRVVTNLGYLEVVEDIALQPDGKILVAGSEIRDIYYNTKGMMIVRYNADGTLDESFGEQNGYTLYNRTFGDYGSKVQLQTDGNIIVGGTHAGDQSFIFVRFQRNGRVDSSYGVNGYVETKFGALGGFTELADMKLDFKGRLVAAGPLGTSEGAAVTRYLPNGDLDSSFDTDGKLQFSFDYFPYLTPNALLVQANGNLVVSGYTLRRGDRYQKKALIGLNENGSRDASFGNANGITKTGFTTYEDWFPNAVMQSDGKILLLTTQIDEFPYDSVASMYLTRFNGYSEHASTVTCETGKKKAPQLAGVASYSLNVYPNPATDYITINGLPATANTTITISNGLGKTVAVYNVSHSAQYKCDVSKLTAAIYYVTVKTTSETEVLKFIKE